MGLDTKLSLDLGSSLSVNSEETRWNQGAGGRVSNLLGSQAELIQIRQTRGGVMRFTYLAHVPALAAFLRLRAAPVFGRTEQQEP